MSTLGVSWECIQTCLRASLRLGNVQTNDLCTVAGEGFAMASLIPREAPVTSAVLPFRGAFQSKFSGSAALLPTVTICPSTNAERGERKSAGLIRFCLLAALTV